MSVAIAPKNKHSNSSFVLILFSSLMLLSPKNKLQTIMHNAGISVMKVVDVSIYPLEIINDDATNTETQGSKNFLERK